MLTILYNANRLATKPIYPTLTTLLNILSTVSM